METNYTKVGVLLVEKDQKKYGNQSLNYPRKRTERVREPKQPKEKKKRVDTRVNRVRDPEKLRINIKKYYEKNRDEILKKQREKTRLKNLFKFSIVEKDEDIPVELL